MIGENTSMLNCCWRKRSELWLFNYCSAITSSIPTGIFRYFIITCQGTKYASGHKRVCSQSYTFLPRHDCDNTIITCQGTNVCGHKHEWAQMCLGTNMWGHKRVWAQTCLGTSVSGHKRVWEQTCLGTNVCGHKRVWAQSCEHNHVGSISMYEHKRVVSVGLLFAENSKTY